ncbi:DUF975 family protein [Isobaculum melis]|uniref:Uncharacterized membrane protein n=1 Tax=Isobaculum melis TaxID=142588 RepID=A0A1H9RIC9_9LACT|nr:DUF975 family protein [Isobaculum melis]SER72315.1 Uncharacterized membrane protein [Isobaculum melis]
MKSADYKLSARQSLTGQWGTMIGMQLITIVISILISSVLLAPFNTSEGSGSAVSTIVGLLITFGFSYGLTYASLEVVRGRKANFEMLFVIFKQERYLPAVLLNMTTKIIDTVVSFILMLPIVIVAGVSFISLYTVSAGNITEARYVARLITGMSGIVVFIFLIVMLLFLVVALLLSAYFQMLVLVRLDHPNLSLGEVYRETNRLLMGKWGQLLKLELSFIWLYIAGVFTLCIAYLWIIPYQDVAVSTFYDVMKNGEQEDQWVD